LGVLVEMQSGPDIGAMDLIAPVLVAILFVSACSFLREPNRRSFNAIMIAGAGAAYLNGGFGKWEFVFTAIVTYFAYRGLQSYNFIGVGWLFHTVWDVLHPSLRKSDCALCSSLVFGLRDLRSPDCSLVFRRRAFHLSSPISLVKRP
jgi:hypothetical protein